MCLFFSKAVPNGLRGPPPLGLLWQVEHLLRYSGREKGSCEKLARNWGSAKAFDPPSKRHAANRAITIPIDSFPDRTNFSFMGEESLNPAPLDRVKDRHH